MDKLNVIIRFGGTGQRTLYFVDIDNVFVTFPEVQQVSWCIEAAPSLLEACKEFLELDEMDPFDGSGSTSPFMRKYHDVLIKCREAVAAAEGNDE